MIFVRLGPFSSQEPPASFGLYRLSLGILFGLGKENLYITTINYNFTFPFFLLRIIFLRKKPTILKVFCGIVVFIGLFVCFVPIIFPSCSSEANQEARAVVQVDEVSRLIWPIIFMLGSVSRFLFIALCLYRGFKFYYRRKHKELH